MSEPNKTAIRHPKLRTWRTAGLSRQSGQLHCPRVHKRAVRQSCVKPEWVVVKQRLPRQEGFVLVYLDVPCQTGVIMAFWDGRVFWEHNWPWTVNDVTHWMPLPSAPLRGSQTPVTTCSVKQVDDFNSDVQSTASQRLPVVLQQSASRPWTSRLAVLVFVWTLALLAWSQLQPRNVRLSKKVEAHSLNQIGTLKPPALRFPQYILAELRK
jgi:Protein of unknown function (DUF551)